MQLWVRRVVALASFAILFTVMAGEAAAQGVTSASVTGTVTQDGGQPLEGATVVVTNTTTGQHFQVVSRAGGRYAIENLPPGGPYTVEVRAIGFQAGRRVGVRLELGERFRGDFTLSAALVVVQDVTVQGATDPLINRGRTGAASSVSDSAISNLPSLGRNFTDLISTSPAVASGPGGRPSIAGTNDRFNSIQIDGSVNNDLFGLGSTGAPGGQTSGRAVPLDAVKEFQVLVAPFDVRQGGFTGGLVNAITRSGDNTFSGSAFIFRQGDALVTNTPRPEPATFSTTQFGATFGGPIIRDKAHFFVSVDRQVSTTPYAGVIVGQDFDLTQGAARCDSVVTRVQALGHDAGSCGGFDFDNPTWNVIGKLTSQAGANGQVEFSVNYATSQNYSVSRTSNGAYNLTGGGNFIKNHNITPRFKWTTIFGGRFNNEFIGGYSRIRDLRGPNENFTNVVITSGGGYNLVTGGEISSQANSLDQDAWELTDNLSFDFGKHRLLLGTHNEFFGFHNVFFQRAFGQWNFSSLANFEAGIASQFQRNLPAGVAGVPGGRGDGPIADFNVNQWGLYAQDEWAPVQNLSLSVGLRADVPIFPLTPTSNPKLLTLMGPFFDTGQIPSGNTLWSPRLGFNYDLGGTGSLIIRGGAGIFSGRPAYVWVSNAYTNTGLEQVALNCNGVGTATVPNFNNFGLDPDNQPTACAGGGGLSNAAPDINFFVKDFKFPQTLRYNLGFDKRLPWGVVANVDGMYSTSLNSMYITDDNLTALSPGQLGDTGIGRLTGEGGRIRYGDVTLNTPAAARRTASFRYVLVHTNHDRDYSYAGIVQLQKRFSNRVEFNAGYTYSRSYDQISATSSVALSNYGFATLDGPLSDRNLRPSSFDRPNKISLSGLVHLPLNFDVSMQYVGISGSPYAYAVAGDVNGDGIGSSTSLTAQQNDLFYVPRDTSDISFSTAVDGNAALKQATFDSLDAYISKEPCLASQRGKIMERNSCRNPWQTFLNARISWAVNTFAGHHLELSAAFFNLPHLINNDWGLVKSTTGFEGVNIVTRFTGAGGAFDATNQRNRYSLSMPIFQNVDRNASRGKVLVGARYTF